MSTSPSHARRLEIARAGRAMFDAAWFPIDAAREHAQRNLMNKLRLAFRVPYHDWQAALQAHAVSPHGGELELLVFRYGIHRYGGGLPALTKDNAPRRRTVRAGAGI